MQLQLEDMLVDVREDRDAILADYLPDARPIPVDAHRDPAHQPGAFGRSAVAHLRRPRPWGSAKASRSTRTCRPRGYRLLRKIPRLSDWVIDAVVAHFGDLNHLIEAPLDELAAVPGVGFPRAREIKDGLSRIYESTLLERRG